MIYKRTRSLILLCLSILLVLLIVVALVMVRFKVFAFTNNSTDENSNIKDSFSVLTYNVNMGGAVSCHTCQQLLDLAYTYKPDILCLQEISNENFLRVKKQLDEYYGSCKEMDGKDFEIHRSKFYSHYAMRNFTRYHCVGEIDTTALTTAEIAALDQDKAQMNVMSAEFEIEPGHWVTIFSGHLRSSAYSTARRSMSKKAYWFEGLSLYKRNYYAGKRIRDYEARNVRGFIDDTRAVGRPVIVAGDLNDWCGSDCLDILMSNDLKDVWWEGGNGFGWTYFGWHLRLRLDHILYSGELKLVDVKVIDSDLSDHKPLMARFKLR